MCRRLQQLLNVKSLVTIILTIVFSYLAIKDRISNDQFIVIFTTVISFYFGTQHERQIDSGKTNSE